jgi:hypothetical protein
MACRKDCKAVEVPGLVAADSWMGIFYENISRIQVNPSVIFSLVRGWIALSASRWARATEDYPDDTFGGDDSFSRHFFQLAVFVREVTAGARVESRAVIRTYCGIEKRRRPRTDFVRPLRVAVSKSLI